MTSDLFSVRDQVVIVTGGIGQLGRQFTLALAERGARVAVFDLAAGPEQVKARFGDAAPDANLLFVQVDVTLRSSVEQGLVQVTQHWQVPHGLVNAAALDSPPNAPASENGPFESYPESSWDRVMNVNLKGVFICCQVVGGAMAAAGRGSIVNVSSIYGLVSPDQRIYEYRRSGKSEFYKPAAYSASKSAILNLTRYMATYWAPKNVRVNTVTFGGVYKSQDAEFLRAYADHVPLGRMAREDEYNGVVIFLLSNASSYMTGANLVIDGGWTAW